MNENLYDMLDVINRVMSTAHINANPFVHQSKFQNKASRIQTLENVLPTLEDIPIDRVIYSGNKTIVYFKDHTKVVVSCSSHDSYDHQTAIAYAIIKRIFGKVGAFDANKHWDPYLVDGNGIGLKLEKIANSGYDQESEKKNLAAAKAKAKADHMARQKAEHDAAWQRLVEKRAKEILLEREAAKRADSLTKTKILNESQQPEISRDSAPEAFSKPYQRPDKPFSQFSQEEKREYWRNQNAKRRATKMS